MVINRQQNLILASSNPGKVQEIQSILDQYVIVPQSHYQVPEAEETGTTFIENAIIKARNAARHCKMPAIADDSGLVVDALNGAPGVISARYAGAEASDEENLQKLLTELESVPQDQKTARFICVMVFMRDSNDPFPLIVQGVWEGSIVSDPLGEHGFGYDPVFWVSEHHCTSAQLLPDVKNQLSHRAKALQKLTRQIL